MGTLNPFNLSQIYTLEEIETEITYWSTALKEATVKSYNKDTSQGSQRVESQDLSQIRSELNSWIQAKMYKTGNGGPNIVSQNFGGSRRGF